MVSNKIGSTRRLVATREQLRHRLEASRELLVSLCSELGRCDSQNPPGDTTGMIASCRKLLDGIEGITVETVISAEPKVNLVARLAGEGAGPRLVMNGHLDTGPVVDLAQWTFPPFGGVIATDRIYGRGIADMKAGVAAIALAMRTLAEFRGHLRGELVLMLVADEGSGARQVRSTFWRRGPSSPAMHAQRRCGSPRVVRIGEKGFGWLEIEARGKSAAGASPHLGDNAIERLLPALDAIRTMANDAVSIPDGMKAAIEKARRFPRNRTAPGRSHAHAYHGQHRNGSRRRPHQ